MMIPPPPPPPPSPPPPPLERGRAEEELTQFLERKKESLGREGERERGGRGGGSVCSVDSRRGKKGEEGEKKCHLDIGWRDLCLPSFLSLSSQGRGGVCLPLCVCGWVFGGKKEKGVN